MFYTPICNDRLGAHLVVDELPADFGTRSGVGNLFVQALQGLRWHGQFMPPAPLKGKWMAELAQQSAVALQSAVAPTETLCKQMAELDDKCQTILDGLQNLKDLLPADMDTFSMPSLHTFSMPQEPVSCKLFELC